MRLSARLMTLAPPAVTVVPDPPSALTVKKSAARAAAGAIAKTAANRMRFIWDGFSFPAAGEVNAHYFAFGDFLQCAWPFAPPRLFPECPAPDEPVRRTKPRTGWEAEK